MEQYKKVLEELLDYFIYRNNIIIADKLREAQVLQELLRTADNQYDQLQLSLSEESGSVCHHF